jgi:hypothetical protein
MCVATRRRAPRIRRSTRRHQVFQQSIDLGKGKAVGTGMVAAEEELATVSKDCPSLCLRRAAIAEINRDIVNSGVVSREIWIGRCRVARHDHSPLLLRGGHRHPDSRRRPDRSVAAVGHPLVGRSAGHRCDREHSRRGAMGAGIAGPPDRGTPARCGDHPLGHTSRDDLVLGRCRATRGKPRLGAAMRLCLGLSAVSG